MSDNFYNFLCSLSLSLPFFIFLEFLPLIRSSLIYLGTNSKRSMNEVKEIRIVKNKNVVTTLSILSFSLFSFEKYFHSSHKLFFENRFQTKFFLSFICLSLENLLNMKFKEECCVLKLQ